MDRDERARIEFLWWAECPSWERALAILSEEVTAAGLDSGMIESIEVKTEADAERLGFPGSPTIRIDGEDVDPTGEAAPTGFSCRVYRRADGRASPLPEREDIRAALARARQEAA